MTMNPHEILNNLASLEKELQNIKSARILAESTISCYQDTQKKIARLLDGLGRINTSMVAIVEGFKSQDKTLSDRLKKTIGKIEADLTAVSNSFQSECDKSNSSFNKEIANAINDLQQKMAEISGEFSANNDSFKQHIDKLWELAKSIAKANANVGEIKEKTVEFQERLEGYYKKLDEAIEVTGKKCGDMGVMLKEINERHRDADERLKKVEQFIADDSVIRKSNYEMLQKSSKHIQIYLIIALLLLIFSIICSSSHLI